MLAPAPARTIPVNATRSVYLVLAGAGSFLAALLHLACIAGGPSWYRAMGAGERMATLAARGDRRPTLITLAITGVLVVWGLYAWSGAGWLPRLPLLKAVLCVITAVYLLRGVVFRLLQTYFPGNGAAFWFWSSAICVGLGLLHLLGLLQAWNGL